MSDDETKEVKRTDEEYHLTPGQISFFRWKLMRAWTAIILHKFPKVELFGGAVRDEIASTNTDGYFSPDKWMVPKDLDFRVRTQKELTELVAFVQTSFAVKARQSQYPGIHHELFQVRIPVFPKIQLPDELYIKMDLVWWKNADSVCDFDVNSLFYNGSRNIESSLGDVHLTPLQKHRNVAKIMDHIAARTAIFCHVKKANVVKADSDDDSEDDDYVRSVMLTRVYHMLRKGFTVVMQKEPLVEFSMIKGENLCKCQEKNALYHSPDLVEGLCKECFDKVIDKFI